MSINRFVVDLVGSFEGDVNFLVFFSERVLSKKERARPQPFHSPSAEWWVYKNSWAPSVPTNGHRPDFSSLPRDCLLCFSSRAIYDSPVPVGGVKGWRKEALDCRWFPGVCTFYSGVTWCWLSGSDLQMTWVAGLEYEHHKTLCNRYIQSGSETLFDKTTAVDGDLKIREGDSHLRYRQKKPNLFREGRRVLRKWWVLLSPLRSGSRSSPCFLQGTWLQSRAFVGLNQWNIILSWTKN